uniref:Protein KTI12 homolog n=1 Tax=Simocephalus serrulatus TaxID=117539 RepID=A0A4Y7NMA0_9CRUS|nr:EOG090X0A11 [Simocephalus serrulatus]SVE94379.1 EOG090X0A11 [Simocephalus serrulatus]
MPLILLTGFPASGKSTRAQQLKNYFTNVLEKNVILLSENDVVKNKQVYSDANKEKELRSALKSEMQRLISQEDLLILDGGNYIKGYRYELYCTTKSNKTTQCTVHVDTSSEQAWKQNLKRDEEDCRYTQENFDSLVMRYEAPDGRNRWDAPLFTIQTEDELPFEKIAASLYERKAPAPNQSTQSLPLTSTNFLYELDCVTQEIVNRVVEAQKTCVIGDEVTIPNSSEKFLLKRRYQLSELSRIRRQFISFAKTHPVDDIPKLAAMFFQYLTSHLV